jgi:hypothetical protein
MTLDPRSQGLPGSPLDGPITLVNMAEQLRDIFNLVSDQLLQHLLGVHSLSKRDNNRGWRDAKDGIVKLGKALDKRVQRLPKTQLHDVEVDRDVGPRE